jgi:phytoene/squalene synthetase
MDKPSGKKPTLKPNATLARSITWKGSKQTYFTTRLLVDHDLVEDCYRAYAYFRWADDVIDGEEKTTWSRDQRIEFINRQRTLIEQCYQDQSPNEQTPEEKILVDLIIQDRRANPGLKSFIRNFLALLEFDAGRRGRFITQEELTWYSNCLATAVTDGIHYFIGNDYSVPWKEQRYDAVFAAHVVHMLRDMVADIEAGYINIPREYIDAQHLKPGNVKNPQFRAWVQNRVELARSYLRSGKQYLDGLEILRAKIAGYWYCARYTGILDAIERDGYVLRREYKRSLLSWIQIAWIGIMVTLKHTMRWVMIKMQKLRDQRKEFIRPSDRGTDYKTAEKGLKRS